MKYILVAYCSMTILLFSTSWAVRTVVHIPAMRTGFDDVMFELSEIVRITMLIYYCVKYNMNEDNIENNVIKNIHCADESFERIGVKVPHNRQRMACVATAFTVASMWIINIYFNITNAKGHSNFHRFNELYTACSILVWISSAYSRIFLASRFIFMLYIVKHRLGLLRCVFEKNAIRFGRKIAWDGDVSIYLGPTNEAEVYFKEICLINSCMYEAYCSVKTFYNQFCYLNEVLFVMMTSLLIKYCVMTLSLIHIC